MKSRFQAALAVAAVVGTSAASNNFDWDAVTPSHDLEYHDCHGTFQCARLLLPLDWLDEKSNETIALAIIKSDAVVDRDDPTYGGPVLSNPGGPGASGVEFLRTNAALQREMVDTPGKKHFEYVSFDPRGIGRTTPQVNCYPDGELPRRAATLESRGSGGLNGGPAALPYGLGLASIESDRCAEANGDLLRYVGTTSVARDMLALVEKIDKYNKKHSKKSHATKKETEVEDDARVELRSIEGSKDEPPRLQYLGFSYGTVLGNYFASMFPERIGRILLDGVCDIDDYTTGDGWLSNTIDTDEMVDMFFQGCFEAGQDTCSLYRKGDLSGSDISRRFWAWVENLDESPAFVTKDGHAAVLQPDDLRSLLLNTMYKPLELFQKNAALVDEAMQGNTTALYEFVSTALGGPLEDACIVADKTAPILGSRDAETAILCGDADDITGRNTTFWRGYVARQLAQSAVAGASWSNIRVACADWKAKAKWQFHGPFTTPEPSKNASAPEPGRPAAPVLFLSNRFDPVTPLQAARKVSRKYPGSALLVQEAMGHCVLSSRAVTNCTKTIVRRYFAEGVVPSEETTCKAACDPWEPKCDFTGSQLGTLSVDREIRPDWPFPLHI